MDDIIDLVWLKVPVTPPAKPGPSGRELPFRPGDPRDFEEDERAFGYPLPPLLKRMYAEIGNGRFGPGYGLIGLKGGYTDSSEGRLSAIALAREKQARASNYGIPRYWPAGRLPLCNWGCGVLSVVDCIDRRFRMLVFDDAYMDEVTGSPFFDQHMRFDAWIAAWARDIDLWSEVNRAIGRGVMAREAELDERHAL